MSGRNYLITAVMLILAIALWSGFTLKSIDTEINKIDNNIKDNETNHRQDFSNR
jgi:hypothetical protein